MIKNPLEKLKKDYLNIIVPIRLKRDGWGEISNKISKKASPGFKLFSKRFAYSFSFGIFLFAFLFGFGSLVYASLPQSSLYPLKIASEKIIKKVTGKSDLIINNRFNEMVKAIENQKGQEENLEAALEAVKNYKAAIEAARGELNNKEAADFDHRLNKQKEEIKTVIKGFPRVEKELNKDFDRTFGNDTQSLEPNQIKETESLPEDTNPRLEEVNQSPKSTIDKLAL